VQTLAFVLDLSYCIQPLGGLSSVLGAFCSSSYLLFLEPSDVIPDMLVYCIRFLLFPNKEVRSIFVVPYQYVDEILYCVE
jgi:hypothetical protein